MNCTDVPLSFAVGNKFAVIQFRIIMFPNFCTSLRRIIQVNVMPYRLKQSMKCGEQIAARKTFKGHNSYTETITSIG